MTGADYQQSPSGLRFTEVNVFLAETKSTPESTGEELDGGKKEDKERLASRVRGERPSLSSLARMCSAWIPVVH